MRWIRWLRGLELPPWGRGLPPIAVGFYACTGCGSMWGGIMGKGPSKSLRAEGARDCRHCWVALTGSEFRAQGTQRFGIDWNTESQWWRNL